MEESMLLFTRCLVTSHPQCQHPITVVVSWFTPMLSRLGSTKINPLKCLTTSNFHKPTPHQLHTKTPAYPGHIPLNWFENAFLAVGSGLMSLADPRRGGKKPI